MDLRTPMGRVRGLGAAGEGVGHWWAQRLTSIAMVPLTLWFVYAAVGFVGVDHAAFKSFLGEHGNALLMVLFVAVMFHHAQQGLQVVIEDYVHHEGAKVASLVAVKFLAVLCAGSAILSVLRLAFGA